MHINPSNINTYELDYTNMLWLVDYKLAKHKELFDEAFGIYVQTLTGKIEVEFGFSELLRLRHEALIKVNHFLADPASEKEHDMTEDDVEGWAIYEEVSEAYRIYDFFVVRLHKNLSNYKP